jgi:hypothetical protein
LRLIEIKRSGPREEFWKKPELSVELRKAIIKMIV